MKLASQQKPTATAQLDATNKEFVEALGRQSAAGDYIHVARTTDQTNIVADEVVDFTLLVKQRGSLALDGGGAVSGFKAGRTYILSANARISDGVACSAKFGFYDQTGAVQIGEGWEHSSGSNTGSHVDRNTGPGWSFWTPIVDSVVEVRVITVSPASTDLDATAFTADHKVFFQAVEVGATVVNAVAGLEYMDTIVVGADTQDVSFGAGGDGALSRALDGDVDEEYLLSYFNPPSTATTLLSVRPNAAAATYLGSRHFAGSSTNFANHAFLQLAGASTGFASDGWAELKAETGRERSFYSRKVLTDGATRYVIQNSGQWTDTVANITSLQIHSDIAGGIKNGAIFKLWRRTRSVVSADSADTYERRFESAVEVGTATVEQTSGHSNFTGSVVGLSVRIEEAVTAGTVTVNLKVDGATTLSVVLDTTNTVSGRAVASFGTHDVVPDKNISIEVVAAGYDNTDSVTAGMTVVATMTNDAFISAPAGFTDVANTYTKAQVVTPAALVYGANVAVDAADSNVFTLTLTGATAQLDNPTNLQDGHTLVFRVTQDGTGGRALTFDTIYDFGDEGAPDLTSEAAAGLSIVTCMSDGTKLWCTALKGFVA
jgi:hypothetical protein